MIATIVNALAVLLGSFLGLLFKRRLSERYEETVYTATGIISIVIGVGMALKATHTLAFALALILGGLSGSLLDVEGWVLRLGESLKRRFAKRDSGATFATGFLDASILFCAGAMAIVGSFKAGTEGDYGLIFTKSVMDGCVAVLLSAALGSGVAFSALTVLVYQGALTLLSVWVKPFVSELMLAELTGTGGALVIMIGINLLGIKKLKTANFLPTLVFTVLFVLAMPSLPLL
jgi:uncharacterized membrane protein YqgA involved in biofilm formation